MSLEAKYGSFQIPAASTDAIEVAVPGMQVQAVLFWWNGRDSAIDAAGEASHRFGFGWAAMTELDPVQRCVTCASLHGSDGGETDTYAASGHCIATIQPGTDDPAFFENYADALFGFETFSVTPAGVGFFDPLRVHYLAIGGGEDPILDGDPDITNLAVGTFEIAATGDLDVTDVGFQPDFLAFLSWGSATEDVVIAGIHACLGIAVGAGPLDQFYCYEDSDDDLPEFPTATSHAAERGWVISGLNEFTPQAILAAMLPNGFRLNVQVAPGSPTKHYYLAIKGGRFKVDELLTSITDTDPLALANVGFPPKAALFVSGTTPVWSQANLSISIGAAAGNPVVQGAVLAQDKTGMNPSTVFTALDYANVYVNADDGTPQAIEGKVAVTALGGDGVGLVQTDGDPDPTPVLCLLIGAQAASSLVDAYGYLRLGAPIIYVGSVGHEEAAYLDQPYAAFGDTVNLAVMRLVGGVMAAVSILAVQHQSTGSGPPYWIAVDSPAQGGEATAPPILRTSS